MSYNVETSKVLLWDNQTQKMVQRVEVTVQLIGNKGTVYIEEGPLYCTTSQEIHEAVGILKERIAQHLLKEYRGDEDGIKTS